MPINFTCPLCGAQSTVDDRYAGQTGPCRQCGGTVTIPGEPNQPFSPPPARSNSLLIVVIVLGVAVVGLLFCGGIGAALLLPAVQAAREAARRSQCTNNLKQIAFALQNYHDVYQQFPPQYIADENGKPMHSWRVLILPFIEHKDLYDQYRFDEPWDGPNNRLLAARMPPVFRCPSEPTSSQEITSYVGISGPGTVFNGAQPTRMSSITDGSSNTIVVVEFAGGGVHWMEPRDLDASQLSGIVNPADGRNISSYHPGGANAAFADGSVRFLPASIGSQELQALTTIAGGEIISAF